MNDTESEKSEKSQSYTTISMCISGEVAFHMVFELVPWWAGEQREMEDFGDKGHDGSKRQGGEKCSAWQSLSHFY